MGFLKLIDFLKRPYQPFIDGRLYTVEPDAAAAAAKAAADKAASDKAAADKAAADAAAATAAADAKKKSEALEAITKMAKEAGIDLPDADYLKRLREGEAAARVAEKAAIAKAKELEDAEAARKLKEDEAAGNWKKIAEEAAAAKAKAEADAATQVSAATTALVAFRIEQVATQMGLKKEALQQISKLVDMSKITLDAGGNLVGATEVLTELKTGMPFLFDAAPAGGGGTGPDGRPGGSGPDKGGGGNGKTNFKDSTVKPEAVAAGWDALRKGTLA